MSNPVFMTDKILLALCDVVDTALDQYDYEYLDEAHIWLAKEVVSRARAVGMSRLDWCQMVREHE